MKTIFYKFTFRLILVVGILVGVMKGQEAKQKWISKKKIRYEAKLANKKMSRQNNLLVVLDEIEMQTYHS